MTEPEDSSGTPSTESEGPARNTDQAGEQAREQASRHLLDSVRDLEVDPPAPSR